MKLLRHLVTFAFMLTGALTNAEDKPAVVAATNAVAGETVGDPKKSDLDGLVVQGTMKQIIGVFSTYGHVHIGDTFELEPTNLPKEMIKFTRPHFDPKKDVSPYVPFGGPLTVEKVEMGSKEIAGSVIRLTSEGTANRTGGNLVIQVRVEELKSGSKAKIYFYETSGGNIRCMAEAEGVLK